MNWKGLFYYMKHIIKSSKCAIYTVVLLIYLLYNIYIRVVDRTKGYVPVHRTVEGLLIVYCS